MRLLQIHISRYHIQTINAYIGPRMHIYLYMHVHLYIRVRTYGVFDVRASSFSIRAFRREDFPA